MNIRKRLSSAAHRTKYELWDRDLSPTKQEKKIWLIACCVFVPALTIFCLTAGSWHGYWKLIMLFGGGLILLAYKDYKYHKEED